MAASFAFHHRLGAGHFGEVWLVTETGLNAKRALKVIPPDKVISPTNFFHEAQLLKAAEHPNVVRIEETGTLDDSRLYVAMEYLPKGSVEDEAKGNYLPLTRAKRLMVDLLRGLQHAHNQGVLHRDVKPANILIGNAGEGKLSDFGLAIPRGLNLKALAVKDYAYALHLAPEVSGPSTYSVLTDIYACGVTLYRLVNGDSYLPVVSPGEAQLLASQGKLPDRQSYRAFIPRPLRTVINKAINVDPAQHFQSADDMRHALEQVTVEKNWSERRLSNGVEWTSGWDSKCYHVTLLRRRNGVWDVTVQKGQAKHALRRVTSLCLEHATKTKAEQHARRVLQDFVLGKLS